MEGRTSEDVTNYYDYLLSLVAPGDQTPDPFIAGLINGIQTVGLRGDLLIDGSILARMVGANEIIAQVANIKDGVITNAKIENATIETAKIKDLNVTTVKIANQAVTIPVSVFTADTFDSGDATWKTMQQLTIISTGSPIYIHISFVEATYGTTEMQTCRMQLLRDSTVIYEPCEFHSFVWNETPLTMAISIGMTDQPGSGNHTYYLQIYGGVSHSVQAWNRSIILLETKK